MVGMPWQPTEIDESKNRICAKRCRPTTFERCAVSMGSVREWAINGGSVFWSMGWRSCRKRAGVRMLSPEALNEEVLCRMVRLKERHRHWGPRKIRELYGRQWGQAPSESSFKRVLDRCGWCKSGGSGDAQTGRLANGAQSERRPMKYGRWISRAGGMMRKAL